MKGEKMYPGKSVKNIWVVLIVLLPLVSAITGCGESSRSADTAIPEFCPTYLASNLAAPLSTANTPPRAYYQRITTTENTPIEIILFTCDPDDPTSSEGLSWDQPLWDGMEGPFNGSLSAYSGTYPEGGLITYAPDPGFVGTDSFFYQVFDGQDLGNVAGIEITVTAALPSATSLYFGGWDDAGTFQLWIYSSGTLSPVAGGASVITASYGEMHDRDVLGNRLFFITDVGDGGGALSSYTQSGGFMTHFNMPFYLSNMAVMGGTAYIGENTSTGYLWAADEGGAMTTLSGTSGRYPQNLAGNGGVLYFGGDDVGYYQLWTRNASGVFQTHSSSMMGLNPDHFTPFDNDIFFVGDTDMGQRTLWRFNGASPISTVGNLDIPWLWNTSALAVLDSVLCINARANTAAGQMWSYHPARGFSALTNNTGSDVSPTHMTEYSGQLFFNGYDDTGQSYLWHTDGTAAAGTVPGTAGLEPRHMAVYDNKLFFAGGTTDIQLRYIDSSLGAPTRVSFITSANGWNGLAPSGLIEY